MSGPDPSKPFSSATAILRDQPEEVGFETDFADLVARFSAKSGGGLSPDISADLALEIVLNEIVEQACRMTGATGAAILLERGGEMVCRASSGPTAPELGSRIDAQSGLAAQCLQTRRTQWCDDTLVDPRADIEASERVGVRSVVVMPLVRGGELAGVFELFSPQPFAFGVRDERALEALADRTLSNLQQASRHDEPDQPEVPERPRDFEPPSVGLRQEALALAQHVEPVLEIRPERVPHAPRRETDVVVRLLGVAVLAAAVLLGVAVGRHLGWTQARASRPPHVVFAKDTAAAAEPQPIPAAPKQAEVPAKPSAAPPSHAGNPPGGLIVFDRGKEVYRLPPTEHPEGVAGGNGGLELASENEAESVVQLSEDVAKRNLLQRVEPQYPEAALQHGIEGEVVLEIHVGTDGSVLDVQVVRGPALLSQASTIAVKQWRFKPFLRNGRPAEMQTRIALNFKLPE